MAEAHRPIVPDGGTDVPHYQPPQRIEEAPTPESLDRRLSLVERYVRDLRIKTAHLPE